jgi:hypothetical protein
LDGADLAEAQLHKAKLLEGALQLDSSPKSLVAVQ